MDVISMEVVALAMGVAEVAQRGKKRRELKTNGTGAERRMQGC